MRKWLLNGLLILIAVGPACVTLTPHYRLTDSIQPLQMKGQTFCTAFAINGKEKLWATAKHCIQAADEALAYDGDSFITLKGEPVTILFQSPGKDDIAVIQARVGGTPLQLALFSPDVGDNVMVAGYPYGLFGLVEVWGHIASRSVPLDGVPNSDILDITIAGGNSGSPVLMNGQVVGLLWGRFRESEHGVALPWENVKRLIGSYFGL